MDEEEEAWLAEQDRLAETMRTVVDALSRNERLWFAEAVDDDIIPGYTHEIGCPMDLGLVLRRMEHHFYRRTEAIVRDVKLVLENCIKFNQDGSDIVESCRDVVGTVLSDVLGQRRRRVRVRPPRRR